jgi:hypothetical protein
MILLVVGVVAVIVVILIAVFLSIRLGRSDEHDGPATARPGGSDRRRAGGDHWGERDTRDRRRPGYGERTARSREHEGSRDHDHDYDDGDYEDYDGYRERRPPRHETGPRSRAAGYASSPGRRGTRDGRARYESHRSPRPATDDFPSGDYPPVRYPPEEFGNAEYPDYPSDDFESPRGGGRRGADAARGRSGSRRKPGLNGEEPGPEPAKGPKGRSRPLRGRRDDDDDWPSTEWDKLSDEQYWAELSADKPLSTMARPAQPSGRGKPGKPAAKDAAPAGQEMAAPDAAPPRAASSSPRSSSSRASASPRTPAPSRAPSPSRAAPAAQAPAAQAPAAQATAGSRGRPESTSQPLPAPLAPDQGGRRAAAAQRDDVTERLPVREPLREPATERLPVRHSADAPQAAGRGYLSGAGSYGSTAGGRHAPARATGPHSTEPYSTGPHSAGPHSAGPHSAGSHSPGRHSTGEHSVPRARDLVPPVPGALDEDPLTSPSLTWRAIPASDSRSYRNARKGARAAGADPAESLSNGYESNGYESPANGHSDPLGGTHPGGPLSGLRPGGPLSDLHPSGPLSVGAPGGGNGYSDDLAASYGPSGQGYHAAPVGTPAAQPPGTWHGAPAGGDQAHTPAYGNPYGDYAATPAAATGLGASEPAVRYETSLPGPAAPVPAHPYQSSVPYQGTSQPAGGNGHAPYLNGYSHDPAHGYEGYDSGYYTGAYPADSYGPDTYGDYRYPAEG